MLQIVRERRLSFGRHNDWRKWTTPKGICQFICWRLYFLSIAQKKIQFWICVMICQVGERILCRHPFTESKRAYVVPQRVEELLQCYWPGNSGMNPKEVWFRVFDCNAYWQCALFYTSLEVDMKEDLPPLKEIRQRCINQLEQMRPDHMRRLNPTPYKVGTKLTITMETLVLGYCSVSLFTVLIHHLPFITKRK